MILSASTVSLNISTLFGILFKFILFIRLLYNLSRKVGIELIYSGSMLIIFYSSIDVCVSIYNPLKIDLIN